MPGLRSKTFLITIGFLACVIGYSGISLNTMNMEATNQLYNFLFLSFIDIPSSLLGWKLITTRLGRRWTCVGSLSLCGFSLVVPALVPGYNSTLYTVCTILGKFGVASTYMVIYQHASELFPTTLRNQGLGICATLSSIVGIFVPQLIYMVHTPSPIHRTITFTQFILFFLFYHQKNRQNSAPGFHFSLLECVTS